MLGKEDKTGERAVAPQVDNPVRPTGDGAISINSEQPIASAPPSPPPPRPKLK